MDTTVKDADKSEVYAAERSVRNLLDNPGTAIKLHGSTIMIPEERRFARIEDIQVYVDAVLKHIGKPYGIKVRTRKGDKFAHYEPWTNTIAVPDNAWARREVVVLHEVAHALSSGDGHGPKFRAAFVELMGATLGPEASFILSSAFFENGLTLGQ